MSHVHEIARQFGTSKRLYYSTITTEQSKPGRCFHKQINIIIDSYYRAAPNSVSKQDGLGHPTCVCLLNQKIVRKRNIADDDILVANQQAFPPDWTTGLYTYRWKLAGCHFVEVFTNPTSLRHHRSRLRPTTT